MQGRQHDGLIARSPRPQPFTAHDVAEHRRRIELLGLALDDVVEAFVCVSAQEGAATQEELRRISAAARRLSERAHSLARVRHVATR